MIHDYQDEDSASHHVTKDGELHVIDHVEGSLEAWLEGWLELEKGMGLVILKW